MVVWLQINFKVSHGEDFLFGNLFGLSFVHPAGLPCAHVNLHIVFTIPDEDPVENYSFMETITKTVGTDKNQKVILIGFNKGMALANTTDGIKSQYTVGNISQKDDNQMMYTIPSLPGSSGSPVLNLRGELVAVNYAGISSTQSFNYGVRINYLRNLAAQ